MALRLVVREIAAILLVVVLPACGQDDARPSVTERANVTERADSVAAMHETAGVGHVHAGARDAVPQAVTPQQVRLQLEQLLGQHAILAVRLMRGKLNRSPDFVEAATAALGKNTDELSVIVASAYGPEGGNGFKQLWAQHVSSLFAYSKGLADKDAAAQRNAKAELDRYTGDFGAFVSSATKGELPAAQVTAGVKTHIHHLISQVDAYGAGDYAAAYRLEREAYAAMFSTGKGLAAATVSARPGELPAGFDDPPQQLRSALGRLLGEHSELIVDATRAVIAKGAEFEQAAAALDGNTRDIGQAMTAVFGPQGAAQFGRLWATHVDAVVRFATAVAESDAAGQAQARARLDRFAQDFGRYLATLVKGKAAAEAFVAAAHQHDQQLLTSIMSYARGDYPTAHQITYEGYQHMFAIAESLADAIEGMAAKQLPKGGAATGGGGTAGDRGR
jgi:hypothetical protein